MRGGLRLASQHARHECGPGPNHHLPALSPMILPVPESILRHRPFMLYWSARTCVALGYQMLGVAVAWQMYAITGSAFDLGLVGLIQFLPAAAFMLVAGQVADRYDRRRLLQICQTVEGLAAAALAVGSAAGWVTKEFILAAVFV